ncbi:FixH family protein, partial [Photobacterium chitinilyticum]|uniref:FixH family protein n=1 Tax=Photobacterium chitinilyticum TaxID=2485123 RepID=UPI003D0BB7E0
VLIKYVVITLLLLVNNPLLAGTLLPVTVQTSQYNISTSPTDPPIRLNQIQSWIIAINDPSGQPVQGLQFSVDGGMPAHKHGLPTQPRLTEETEPGKYIIDGVKFNMYGKWQIELTGINESDQFHQIIKIDIDHVNSN